LASLLRPYFSSFHICKSVDIFFLFCTAAFNSNEQFVKSHAQVVKNVQPTDHDESITEVGASLIWSHVVFCCVECKVAAKDEGVDDFVDH